jgi:hypothetical protein
MNGAGGMREAEPVLLQHQEAEPVLLQHQEAEQLVPQPRQLHLDTR